MGRATARFEGSGAHGWVKDIPSERTRPAVVASSCAAGESASAAACGGRTTSEGSTNAPSAFGTHGVAHSSLQQAGASEAKLLGRESKAGLTGRAGANARGARVRFAAITSR